MRRIKDTEDKVITYNSYASMIVEIGQLSDKMDSNASLGKKIPNFSFKTKDGLVHLAGNFKHMVENFKEVLGLDVNPESSKQYIGAYIISFNKYEKAQDKELPSIQVKEVDTPAKKRATRKKAE